MKKATSGSVLLQKGRFRAHLINVDNRTYCSLCSLLLHHRMQPLHE